MMDLDILVSLRVDGCWMALLVKFVQLLEGLKFLGIVWCMCILAQSWLEMCIAVCKISLNEASKVVFM